jgi:hypothetical protein
VLFGFGILIRLITAAPAWAIHSVQSTSLSKKIIYGKLLPWSRRTIAQGKNIIYKKYIPDFLNLKKGMALFYRRFARRLARNAFDTDPMFRTAMVL